MSKTKNRPIVLLFCPLLLLGLKASAQAPVLTPPKLDVKPLTPAQAIDMVGGPTLITIHVSGVPVPQVYDDFIQQASLSPVDTTRLGSAPSDKVTLDLDHVPFWRAASSLCAQTHIGFSEVGPRSDQTFLQPSYGEWNPLEGRVFASGSFFVVAESARRNSRGMVSYTETGANVAQNQHGLSVFLTLLIDPKIHIVPDTTRLTVLEATDELHKPLLEAPGAEADVNTDARYVLQTSIRLLPQTASRSIQQLRGTLHINMVTKMQKWEIADLTGANGSVKTITTMQGPAQLSIVSAQPDDRGYRVSVSYQGPTYDLNYRSDSALLFGTMSLTDSQGTSLPGFIGSSRGSNADESTKKYTAEISFSMRGQKKLIPPLKLSWNLPTSLAPVDIPFEFNNLPLP